MQLDFLVGEALEPQPILRQHVPMRLFDPLAQLIECPSPSHAVVIDREVDHHSERTGRLTVVAALHDVAAQRGTACCQRDGEEDNTKGNR